MGRETPRGGGYAKRPRNGGLSYLRSNRRAELASHLSHERRPDLDQDNRNLIAIRELCHYGIIHQVREDVPPGLYSLTITLPCIEQCKLFGPGWWLWHLRMKGQLEGYFRSACRKRWGPLLSREEMYVMCDEEVCKLLDREGGIRSEFWASLKQWLSSR